MECYLIVLFCTSLMTIDVEHLFMGLLAVCLSSLEKCLFKFFAHFWSVFCCFTFLSTYQSSLYYLDINPLSDIWFVNILSHSMGCPFILLIVSFDRKILKIFIKFTVYICAHIHTHIYIYSDYFPLDYYKIFNIVPYAVQ